MRCLVLAALLLSAGCARRGAGDPAAEAARPVTLEGYAADARAGAVLMTDEGDTIYVAGLPAWPGDLLGRRVEVTGRLDRKKLIPDPEVNEKGEHTAGAYGLQDVLEGASWKLKK
jgi:hypothetical protein